jgi:hypothetical protein
MSRVDPKRFDDFCGYSFRGSDFLGSRASENDSLIAFVHRRRTLEPDVPIIATLRRRIEVKLSALCGELG